MASLLPGLAGRMRKAPRGDRDGMRGSVTAKVNWQGSTASSSVMGPWPFMSYLLSIGSGDCQTPSIS